MLAFVNETCDYSKRGEKIMKTKIPADLAFLVGPDQELSLYDAELALPVTAPSSGRPEQTESAFGPREIFELLYGEEFTAEHFAKR